MASYFGGTFVVPVAGLLLDVCATLVPPGAPCSSGWGRVLGGTGSGAGLEASFGALQPWRMLHAGPCASRGRCMPRILLAFVSILSVRLLILCSSSVGHDIPRWVCIIPWLRT